MAKGHSTSRLGDELTGLEGDEPERWENCLDWPDPFVVFETTHQGSLEGVPNRCPRCGYEPFAIIMRFIGEGSRLQHGVLGRFELRCRKRCMLARSDTFSELILVGSRR